MSAKADLGGFRSDRRPVVGEETHRSNVDEILRGPAAARQPRKLLNNERWSELKPDCGNLWLLEAWSCRAYYSGYDWTRPSGKCSTGSQSYAVASGQRCGGCRSRQGARVEREGSAARALPYAFGSRREG